MNRIMATLIVLALMTGCATAFAETPAAGWTTEIVPRFATVEEGQQLMREITLYHEQINEKTLAFLLQQKGGTLEEYIDYSAEQVLEFTPADEQRIRDALGWLHQALENHGLQLPDPGVITFVKSTGYEANEATAYTSEGNIFLSEIMFDPEVFDDDFFCENLMHEISHCLSRMFPEYRKTLYSLIHFTVLDEDIDIPQVIWKQIIANPDVEHHNSTAVFTINGEKRECYLVYLTDDVFEKEGDNFFKNGYTGIVPVGTTEIYRIVEVKDFWDVLGRNTYYVDDPEEAMADNFSYALMDLDLGYEDYMNPEIAEGIIDYLKRGDGAAE